MYLPQSDIIQVLWNLSFIGYKFCEDRAGVGTLHHLLLHPRHGSSCWFPVMVTKITQPTDIRYITVRWVLLLIIACGFVGLFLGRRRTAASFKQTSSEGSPRLNVMFIRIYLVLGKKLGWFSSSLLPAMEASSLNPESPALNISQLSRRTGSETKMLFIKNQKSTKPFKSTTHNSYEQVYSNEWYNKLF